MRKTITIILSCLVLAHAYAQDNSDGNLLVGTTLSQRVTARTAAVLKAGTDGLGFYPVTTTTTIKANTGYVAGNKQLLIDLATLDKPVTAINEVKGKRGRDEQTIYDLSGHRIPSTKKGIYVINNQKVLVKP